MLPGDATCRRSGGVDRQRDRHAYEVTIEARAAPIQIEARQKELSAVADGIEIHRGTARVDQRRIGKWDRCPARDRIEAGNRYYQARQRPMNEIPAFGRKYRPGFPSAGYEPASVMRRWSLNRSEPLKKSGQNIPKNRCRTTIPERMVETLAELPFIGDQVGLSRAQPGRPRRRMKL